MMKFLIFGDVVAKTGRKAIAKVLPKLKKELKPDFVIANAENLAHGTGLTKKTLAELTAAGVDFFTGGDHSFDKIDGDDLYATMPNLIRPANWFKVPGVGEKLLTVGKKRVLVINLIGQVFMGAKIIEKGGKFLNPFKVVNQIIAQYKEEKPDAILVDMHSEATSEQVAMGWLLDGRASVLWGTHTHVPTADARIMPQGLGYISDIGMTGARDTVIGVDKDIIVELFLNDTKKTKDWPELPDAIVNALYVEWDEKKKVTKKIKLIQKEVKV